MAPRGPPARSGADRGAGPRSPGDGRRLSEAFDALREGDAELLARAVPCYDVADLPRTNNDLEQFFGSYRYHERRCSGRKVACPGTVVRGSVRLIAAAATPDCDRSKCPTWSRRTWRHGVICVGRWSSRQAVRTLGRRFRRDPGPTYNSSSNSSSIRFCQRSFFYQHGTRSQRERRRGRSRLVSRCSRPSSCSTPEGSEEPTSASSPRAAANFFPFF